MPDLTPKQRLLIVAMGIPCCGKSSVFRELGHIHGLKVFVEPEEEEWPDAVHSRNLHGPFTAITWFRAARVPDLFAADLQRRNANSVLVDSYYDKLCWYYLGKPGMEWLISPEDPYFDLTLRMASLDRKQLPEADVVVHFEIGREVWDDFRNRRGRALDNDPSFASSFFTQEHYKDASTKYCAETGARLVQYRQSVSTPRRAAEELSELLHHEGVLPTTNRQ